MYNLTYDENKFMQKCIIIVSYCYDDEFAINQKDAVILNMFILYLCEKFSQNCEKAGQIYNYSKRYLNTF